MARGVMRVEAHAFGYLASLVSSDLGVVFLHSGAPRPRSRERQRESSRSVSRPILIPPLPYVFIYS